MRTRTTKSDNCSRAYYGRRKRGAYGTDEQDRHGDILEEGVSVSEETHDQIYKRALIKAMNILERSDKSEAELRRKLKTAMFPEDIIDLTVEYVRGFHYIDDQRFAENYIRSHRSGMSRRELQNKLMQKGVSRDDISGAFENCEREYSEQCAYEETLGREPGPNSSELDAAVNTLRKKLNGRTSLDDASKQKIIAFMYRKGYRKDDIYGALDMLGVSVDKLTFFDLSDNF